MLENLASLKLVLYFEYGNLGTSYNLVHYTVTLEQSSTENTCIFVPLAAVHEALSVILHHKFSYLSN